MKPITVVIADDEPLARKKIRMLLAKEAEMRILGEAVNAKYAVEMVNALRPDLLFLDVQMPDTDGFDVLEQIVPEEMPSVIFTTAHDRYAVRAFESQAFDYLLKPFDETRFTKALHRVKSHLTAAGKAQAASKWIESLGSWKNPNGQMERFVIKSAGRIIFVNSSEIDWFEAEANYVRLHVGCSSYSIRGTIGETETKLDRERFVRIHRSIIVNVSRITEVRPCNSGEFIVKMAQGKELPASRSYRDNLEPLLARTL